MKEANVGKLNLPPGPDSKYLLFTEDGTLYVNEDGLQ